MRDQLVLPLDDKYHMFCSRTEFVKSASTIAHVAADPCDPWVFQLMVYKCGR